MKLLFSFLILVNTLVSCSHFKKSNGLDTISLSEGDSSSLSIEEQAESTYGPYYNEEISKNKLNEKRIPVHSLNVYSTLYSTLGIVQLFKVAERNNIKFSVITANGFGSLISVIYAKKNSSNYLEWKLFDLLKRIKGLPPFQKKWNDQIRVFLNKEFGSLELQQLNTLVFIPKVVGKEVKLLSSGKVVERVMAALKLDAASNQYLKPAPFTNDFRSYSSDFHLSIAFTAQRSELKNLSGYEWGIYTNYLSFLNRNTHLYQGISTSNIQVLDEVIPLSDVANSYQDSIEKVIKNYDAKTSGVLLENSSSSD